MIHHHGTSIITDDIDPQVLPLRQKGANTGLDERLVEFVRILARKAARDDYRAMLRRPEVDNLEGN